MNPFHPCLKCGGKEFNMDWDTGLYICGNCDATLESEYEKKSKKTVKRFRNLKDDNEVY